MIHVSDMMSASECSSQTSSNLDLSDEEVVFYSGTRFSK